MPSPWTRTRGCGESWTGRRRGPTQTNSLGTSERSAESPGHHVFVQTLACSQLDGAELKGDSSHCWGGRTRVIPGDSVLSVWVVLTPTLVMVGSVSGMFIICVVS